MNSLLVLTVVKLHVKAARHGDDELVQSLVRVPATLGATRHVIQVVDTLDVKWNLVATFDKGQVATGILDFREVDDFAEVDVVEHLEFIGVCLMSRSYRMAMTFEGKYLAYFSLAFLIE